MVVTNLYPTRSRPYLSPFVKEQVESLRELYPDMVIDVRLIEGERPRWAYLKEIILLPIAVRRGKYDVVHAHFGLALISTLFVGKPIVVTFHGSDLLVSPTKYISRILARRASKVIVVAEGLRRVLGYGELVPCGIDTKKFSLPSSYAKVGYPKKANRLKVLFPSDPKRKIKDYNLYCKTCIELERCGYDVERVHLVNIDRQNVHNIFWESDLMLLTSLSEGSPTVIKEAIAAKLPFVSVDVGDVKSWAEKIDFGIVVVARNPKILAYAAKDLILRIRNREILDNSKCIENLDLQNVSKRIRQIYERVVAKPDA